jgi:EAL domain-containing protein (putative c-di-GMP-specific phosphodiesterase class I)/PAS domain-containing protein
MRLRDAFANIHPYAGAAGMIVLGILLVATIFLTVFDLPWIAFLLGTLCAAAIGLVSRLAYAETTLAAVRENVRYVDAELPSMIAYVSPDGIVRYHNQAFRAWLRARESSINGRSLRDAVGLTVYGQLRGSIQDALAGSAGTQTRVHEGLGVADQFLLTQVLPHFGERGEVIGAFLLQTDVTALQDAAAASPAEPAPSPGKDAAAPSPAPAPSGAPAPDRERRIFVDTLTEELTGWQNVGDRLRAALRNDEFCLYSQAIAPLGAAGAGDDFREVLLRLREEEEGLMPPGAFIPLAEEYGLMPDLDRWVVTHVLDWACASPSRQAARYCINVSPETWSGGGFPEFVDDELRRRGVQGSLLCFEIHGEVAHVRRRECARLVAALGEAGCRTTLCGFGVNAADYGLLKFLPVEYLKIDGSLVLNLARSQVDIIKLKAICRVARATGRATIAEFVEGDETIALLRAHGVDFAQGFGVARPEPLEPAG